ncbi:MAG: hypothetical protein B7X04_00770 [Parcubacteria group bacterium 21-54-25]|nr:MAG: hypothetical protein B7X04_00770 [Parcubacteria group bacterium 21-54-25]HQU07957.1 rod shape-determining protein MreC [Candidatus Paceibacterota bacterium]
MKKPFFRRHSALAESRFLSFAAFLVAIGIFFALLRFVAPSAFLTLSTPILRVGTVLDTQTARVMSGFANAQTLTAERNALVLQNTALSQQNQTLAARVTDLTTLVGTSTPPVPGIVADVLARPPESPYDTLIIDSGQRAGVAIGDLVQVMGGIPIGSISAVSTNAARVVLFSAPQASTTAWVGTSRVPIVLEGAGGGSFTASVPRATNISIGDGVFVPGRGIQPIGHVVRLDAEPAAVTETLRIRPMVNIFSLTMVEVLPLRVP